MESPFPGHFQKWAEAAHNLDAERKGKQILRVDDEPSRPRLSSTLRPLDPYRIPLPAVVSALLWRSSIHGRTNL